MVWGLSGPLAVEWLAEARRGFALKPQVQRTVFLLRIAERNTHVYTLFFYIFSSEYDAWYRALHSKSLKVNNLNSTTEKKTQMSG